MFVVAQKYRGLGHCSKNLDFVHISCLRADQYIANYVLRYGGID